jgi:hypothetical protein
VLPASLPGSCRTTTRCHHGSHAETTAGPERAPVKAKPEGSSLGYKLQLGLFSSMGNAEKLVKELKAKGIEAHTETRVQLGPFKNRAEADEAMAKLRSLGYTRCWRPPDNKFFQHTGPPFNKAGFLSAKKRQPRLPEGRSEDANHRCKRAGTAGEQLNPASAWQTPRSAPTRRPAAGNGLHAGVKTHPFRAVHVMVAKQRGFPAAKAVEGHRHRNRHIDAHHAHLDAMGKFARGTTVTGKDGGAIAIGMLIDQLYRCVQTIHPHHGQHRAEDFFLIDGHPGVT